MPDDVYAYVIVGAGLAGASAVEGIREVDRDGSILLVGGEPHLPYDRPPLTKQLWWGKKQEADIVLHDAAYYVERGVEGRSGVRIVALDWRNKTVRDSGGREHGYGKLLLATGGRPRRLAIWGGELPGVLYFRTVDDYKALRAEAQPGRSALVIGGGFIGSELAASLAQAQVQVTMVFPGSYPASRVFPEGLGDAVGERFRRAGVRLVTSDRPASIVRRGGGFVTRTAAEVELPSDIVVVGVGLVPEVVLAERAGLRVDDGIVVDEHLRSSAPDVYAAGDNASFPYPALGTRVRVEHWDNAREQGRQAGRNMAGAEVAYRHMPYFFSDLFDLGYEAVGDVDSRLVTRAEWDKENEVGVLYYERDGRVRGVMMCNVWGKVDDARALIQSDAMEPAGEGVVAPAGGDFMAQRVTPDQAREMAKAFPDWTCNGESLARDFTFRDFKESMAFVSRVADAAERADHHPDIHVSYAHVRLELTTHKEGCLTDRDFKLARKIDSVL